jgi:hypothetical protein
VCIQCVQCVCVFVCVWCLMGVSFCPFVCVSVCRELNVYSLCVGCLMCACRVFNVCVCVCRVCRVCVFVRLCYPCVGCVIPISGETRVAMILIVLRGAPASVQNSAHRDSRGTESETFNCLVQQNARQITPSIQRLFHQRLPLCNHHPLNMSS